MPVVAHDLQRPFAVDFFLQSPQGFFDWLAFFQFNFGQFNSLPLQRPWHQSRPRGLPTLFSQAQERIFRRGKCQLAKNAPKIARAYDIAPGARNLFRQGEISPASRRNEFRAPSSNWPDRRVGFPATTALFQPFPLFRITPGLKRLAIWPVSAMLDKACVRPVSRSN